MKGKTQKGITLVALIITIIVLLILAVVAISAVSGDGILRHAQNSADQYNAAQIKENTILSNYLDYINKNNPNGGTSNPPEGVDPTPDPEPEPVSIVGKYGNDVTGEENYYIFSENGVGKHYENSHSSAGVVEKNFTYTLTNSTGTITFEDNSTKTFMFEGTTSNKVIICVNKDGDNVNWAYTTDGSIGLPKIDGTTYQGKEEDGIETVSLENGQCIVKEIGEEEGSDWGEYFKCGEYIYIIDDNNIYLGIFQIIDNEVKCFAS